MILDTEQQRKILLDVIMAAQFPGTAIDVVYRLKQDLLEAKLMEQPATQNPTPKSRAKRQDPDNISRLAK